MEVCSDHTQVLLAAAGLDPWPHSEIETLIVLGRGRDAMRYALSQNLRAAMRGVESMTSFAEAVGVSRNAVSYWMAGKEKLPRIASLAKVCEHVGIDELRIVMFETVTEIGWGQSPSEVEPPQLPGLSADELHLNYGRSLDALIRASGTCTRALERRYGISPKTVSNVRHGMRGCPLDDALVFSALFGARPSDMLSGRVARALA